LRSNRSHLVSVCALIALVVVFCTVIVSGKLHLLLQVGIRAIGLDHQIWLTYLFVVAVSFVILIYRPQFSNYTVLVTMPLFGCLGSSIFYYGFLGHSHTFAHDIKFYFMLDMAVVVLLVVFFKHFFALKSILYFVVAVCLGTIYLGYALSNHTTVPAILESEFNSGGVIGAQIARA